MAEESLHALMGVWEGVRTAFTAPSFRLFITLAFGWVCTQGRHAVTQSLVEAGVAAHKHHEAFHRFFSRGTWKPDALGRLLLGLVVGLVPLAQLVFSLDDTLCPKRGPQVFGIGCHRDAVLSSGRHKVLRFGHVWVVLAVVVYLPFCPLLPRTLVDGDLDRLVDGRISEDARACVTLVDGTLAGREQWARTSSEGWPG